MDKQGRDQNITSQAFSSLAYGPENKPNISALTIHEYEPLESALLCLPSQLDVVKIVDVKPQRMQVLDDWTEQNKKRELFIRNFHGLVTGCDGDINATLTLTQRRSGKKKEVTTTVTTTAMTTSKTTVKTMPSSSENQTETPTETSASAEGASCESQTGQGDTDSRYHFILATGLAKFS